jgi:hypothetical protein
MGHLNQRLTLGNLMGSSLSMLVFYVVVVLLLGRLLLSRLLLNRLLLHKSDKPCHQGFAIPEILTS